MNNGSEHPSFFDRLKSGLEEGIQFARGELDLRTTALPDLPPPLAAREVVRLRQQLNMSQRVFARTLNVSPKTVQSWEQGERRPSQAALRLLQVLGARPEVVCQVVGVRCTSAGQRKPASSRGAQTTHHEGGQH
jgi:putative transcriptional regulator